MNSRKVNVLATIPSGFCFGLQHISIDLFANCRESVSPHFLITRWNNGDFEKLVARHGFSYSFSWLGMFSRKLDWPNLKMSLHALSKMPRLYRDFLALCKNKKPDILFFANHHELILLIPVLWMVNIKVICHMHDPAPAISFQKKTFRWYNKRVDHFIAISDSVKRRLIELGCDQSKVTVVHNGIKLPDLRQPGQFTSSFLSMFNWAPDSFIVGITGQMTETKGHVDLLEAFAIAYKRNPKFRLVIGGKKMEPLFSLLEARINDFGLQNVISFTGWMEDVQQFYTNIDLFVLASRHDEGYGLVVAEAMAQGKPVVITSSGGAVEIVEEGVSGFIVPKGAINELAAAICRLVDNPQLYGQMSINARNRIEQKFSMKAASKKFSLVIKSCAGK